MSLILLAFLVSLAAGIATGLGRIPVLFTKQSPERFPALYNKRADYAGQRRTM